MKGHIRERKPGAGYTACWSDIDPGDGHRRQYSRHFAKRREAQKFLNVVLPKVDDGSWRPDTTITVRQLLCDHWLPAMRSRELRAATLAQYEGVVENWICPKLGGRQGGLADAWRRRRLHDFAPDRARREGQAPRGALCPVDDRDPQVGFTRGRLRLSFSVAIPSRACAVPVRRHLR